MMMLKQSQSADDTQISPRVTDRRAERMVRMRAGANISMRGGYVDARMILAARWHSVWRVKGGCVLQNSGRR